MCVFKKNILFMYVYSRNALDSNVVLCIFPSCSVVEFLGKAELYGKKPAAITMIAIIKSLSRDFRSSFTFTGKYTFPNSNHNITVASLLKICREKLRQCMLPFHVEYGIKAWVPWEYIIHKSSAYATGTCSVLKQKVAISQVIRACICCIPCSMCQVFLVYE